VLQIGVMSASSVGIKCLARGCGIKVERDILSIEDGDTPYERQWAAMRMCISAWNRPQSAPRALAERIMKSRSVKVKMQETRDPPVK